MECSSVHVLGHKCSMCGVVTIPVRFWPQHNGLIASQPDDIKRDYPAALSAYEAWWGENRDTPFAPVSVVAGARKIWEKGQKA